jgi:hypothetical protein
MNSDKYPANVDEIMKSLAGVLALDALPKEKIKEFFLGDVKDTLAPKDGFIDSLGTFEILTISTITFVFVLFILKCCVSKVGKLRKLLDKMIKKICWNMVIKSFQAGFLT